MLGRRADGYHDIESLVAFARVRDRLVLIAGDALDLAVLGPQAHAAGPHAENLVLKAARALAARVEGLMSGMFMLAKSLPVAAGLGGGSADAAAALRLLARRNGIALDDSRVMDAARATGADVPVCLDPRPRLMRGIGDVLSEPLDLPQMPVVLVNPGVALASKDVFAAMTQSGMSGAIALDDAQHMLQWISSGTNDLEPAAISLQPVIADTLTALRAEGGCRLARMSGSGATCFGLFGSARAATAAARSLRAAHPRWWVRATSLG